MIIGASLYGFSSYYLCFRCWTLLISELIVAANATEEFFVRRSPLYEVVGQLGMWGTIINGIQAAGLEHNGMKTASWNGATSMRSIALKFLLAYELLCSQLVSWSPILARCSSSTPLLLCSTRLASSAYYNLSLLSSDFYGLLFGLFLFHYKPYWLYFPSFGVVLSGLVVYFWSATPEEQGKLDPKAPAYVLRMRGEGADVVEDEETGGVPSLVKEDNV